MRDGISVGCRELALIKFLLPLRESAPRRMKSESRSLNAKPNAESNGTFDGNFPRALNSRGRADR